MPDINIDKKIELIKKVQQLGIQWDACASNESVEAVRDGNKSKIDGARYWIAKADTARDISDKVISLIHAYWPQEPGRPPHESP